MPPHYMADDESYKARRTVRNQKLRFVRGRSPNGL